MKLCYVTPRFLTAAIRFRRTATRRDTPSVNAVFNDWTTQYATGRH